MNAYDDIASTMAREGFRASLTTFHGRGTVLRVTGGHIAVLVFLGAGSVEVWPSPGDPNGMPLAWGAYDPQHGVGVSEACELIRTVVSGR